MAFLSYVEITMNSPVMTRPRSTRLHVAVNAAYAPALYEEPATKDVFHNEIHSSVHRVPSREILLIAGDWSVRMGPADEYTGHTRGRFGLSKQGENGNHLVTFVDLN